MGNSSDPSGNAKDLWSCGPGTRTGTKPVSDCTTGVLLGPLRVPQPALCGVIRGPLAGHGSTLRRNAAFEIAEKRAEKVVTGSQDLGGYFDALSKTAHGLLH